ncbi:MAG: beta-ketoacyl-ACP synthase II [Candidatus Omnitrophica bacterium]|nr:beta-ketoacyl-ACP synthase II [Candidatus Omnitrophota bacterium]MCM8799344.1 beta-ketoacyl-ACP synthase II [Candidatus Omnitrophota bacterium]
MQRRVVVTGLGIVSPVGRDVKSFWESLKEARSGIDRISSFDSRGFDSQIAGEVRNFDPLKIGLSKKEINRMERFVQFAISASKEAILDSGLILDKEDKERIGVLIGSGIGSLRIIEEEHKVLLNQGPKRISPFLIPMLIVNEASGQVAITYGFRGYNSCTTTACASGAHAIGEAFKVIQRGAADIMLAGGTESCITPLGVGGFCALKALSTRNDEPQKASRPFDLNRDGFVIAEGAGVVVLEELSHALKRKADIYAELVGYGASCDAYHITAPDPDGYGAYLSMKWALEDAKLSLEQITYINAHGTSTKLNDKVETLAIKRLFKERAKEIMVSSTKSMTGHLLGAAGGVEFVICCLVIKDKVIPPTINYETPDPECDLDYVPNQSRELDNVEACMSNSLGFGGHNATLVIKKFHY